MKRISFFIFVGISIFSLSLFAVPKSYRLQHPISAAHMLPVGETPGWIKKKWVQIDLSQANVWNAAIDLRNDDNGKLLQYTADFEQSDLILEIGSAINDYLAHAIELPYAYRGGGFLDGAIDDFHIAFGFDRFNRQDFPEFQSNFDIQVDGQSIVSDNSASGLANFKYKIKYWPWQVKGKSGQCPCGFATSLQIKVPNETFARGLTTGEADYSAMWHLGLPFFENSAIWLSSAVTYTEKNPLLEDFPRMKWHQMYEVATSWGINKNWSFIFQVRMESPFLDKSKLTILNLAADPEDQLLERIASGWNSLVHWRGSEALGFRYISDSGQHSVQMNLIEDWALGSFDEKGDDLYINNAPDVVLGFQYHYAFD